MVETSETVFAQAAAIPYRRHWGMLQILVITSRKRRRWVRTASATPNAG